MVHLLLQAALRSLSGLQNPEPTIDQVQLFFTQAAWCKVSGDVSQCYMIEFGTQALLMMQLEVVARKSEQVFIACKLARI